MFVNTLHKARGWFPTFHWYFKTGLQTRSIPAVAFKQLFLGTFYIKNGDCALSVIRIKSFLCFDSQLHSFHCAATLYVTQHNHCNPGIIGGSLAPIITESCANFSVNVFMKLPSKVLKHIPDDDYFVNILMVAWVTSGCCSWGEPSLCNLSRLEGFKWERS